MTAARGTRDSQDADDFDVEEALALVKEGSARASSGSESGPGPGPGRGPGPGNRAPRSGSGTPAAPVPTPQGEPHPHTTSSGHGTPDGHKDNDNNTDNSSTDDAARHKATAWPLARTAAERAARSVRRPAPVSVPLDAALGLVIASPLAALTDLPSFDTSAMDGWAVAGPGPWDVRGDGVLAGHTQPAALTDGEAVRIATGARVPQDATAVLRSEHGRVDDKGRLHAVLPQAPDSARAGGSPNVVHGQDIRPRGQECRSGDQLLPVGVLVTPAVLGLAAAAGYDTLAAIPRPRVEVLVLGDELLTEGLPQEGLIRDALGPMLPPWLHALGGEVIAVRRLGDDAKTLHRTITSSEADLIVTTGGTAGGPVDHVHPILRRIGAELLVDGVKVRPGHPMLLARTKENQHLVGLPGNPLAAVSGLLTLAEPLLRVLAGRAAPESYTLPLKEAVHGHPYDTRLIPVVLRGDRAMPLHYNGPAMLRGIAAADALAVVPPGGARAGQELELLDLPWAAAGIEVCFT